MSRLAFGVVLTSIFSSYVAAQQSSEERPQFRISVDTVSLAVTVLDEKQHLVNGLPRENFSVFEDGVEQDVQFFFHGEVPLKMAILIDTSSSMQKKIALAQEAAIRFVRSLKPGDEVQVVEFNDRVLILVELTPDFEKISEAIRQTEVGGATSLYTALYVSLKDLGRVSKDVLARRAIVVLSDGNDTKSMLGFEDVKEWAQKSNVIIYSISLRATKDDLVKEKYRNAKYELDMLARETGGVAYAPEKLEDLAGAYDEIAMELKSQYSLGYVSTNPVTDGSWRRLQILSKEPGTKIRSRNGYFASRPVRRRRHER
jgi:Ca-activated chloride channel family protein